MSDMNSGVEDLPAFVALPVDTFQDTSFEKPEQFRIIKNAIIKTLSDGSLCIIDASDLNENSSQQPIEVTYLPPVDNTQPQNITLDSPQIISKVDDVFQLQKSSNSIYKCPKCKEVFDKIALYKKHMMWHRNVKKYKCDKCSVGYNVDTNLKIHMAMHAEGKPTCPICNITFQRLASLKSHLMLHQVEELYTCEECGAEFEKEEELNKHLQNHINSSSQDDNNLVCAYCNVQFGDKKSYKEHISHHVKIKKMVLSGKKTRKTNNNKSYPHMCNVCLKSFSKLSLLERHLRVHSGERPFICEHCNKGFNQKGTLQIHLSKHTGIKPFHCTLCSAKFNQKGNLRVHVEKTHTAPRPGVKMYKCPHCTCIFKKIASLNVHITKCHANSEEVNDISSVVNKLKELEEQTNTKNASMEIQQTERTIIDQDKKILNEESQKNDANTSYVRLAESFLDGTIRRYLVMQKKVNDVKYYICSYCSKEFKKPSDLIRHTRVHTREKPFACKQCGASFALKSTLFYHVKTHVGNNNFFCAICAKKFTSVRSVNMHLRKHADKPQYKCLSCNKCFSTLQRAKLHNKDHHSQSGAPPIELKPPLVHTLNGLEPLAPTKSQISTKQFSCPICSAKFTKAQNLKRHMLLHNGEKRFKCDQCSKRYFTAHALKEHQLYHSGIRNFACKICGKRFTTSSLLKRHMISHSTNRPYVCPYCSKNFKSLVMCRKHMNVHKNELGTQVRVVNETGQVENSIDTEKLTLEDLGETTPTNASFIQESVDKAIEIISQEPGKLKVAQQDAEQATQELYEIAPNSIHIITESAKDVTQIQDNTSQVQTIFINCEDLHMSDNLYSQNGDAMLFNTLSDLQSSTFSVDPLHSELAAQNTQNLDYNVSNQVFNISEQPISISELASRVLKLTNSSSPCKLKNDKSNLILSDNVLTNNAASLYSQNELNLLFNLDAEFETNNCDLESQENINLADISLSGVPIVCVEQQTKENVETTKENEDKKNFICNKCNKIFSCKKVYMRHIHSHNESKKNSASGHKCSFCNKIFKKHSDLVRHIRTHTGEKPFGCDKCEKKFSLKSTLLSHQKTHNPVVQKEHSCVVCNSFFTSKSSLKVHMTVHTGDKAYKCSFCSMKFRTAAHRKSHENTYHLNPSKKRKNKVTNLLASVAMDVLGQQQTNQVVADDLTIQEPISFPNEELNILNETQPLEPLILQQLQPNFLLQDNLLPSSLIQLDDGTLVNVKTVTQSEAHDFEKVGNEKPRNLECDVCHKKYASKDVLRKHRKIHNKKYKCTKCDKGFDNEEDLKTHEQTHEGLRPFSCLYCANSFSKVHSLTTHVKRIHNISFKDNILLSM